MAIAAVFELPTESVEKYEKVFELGGAQLMNQPKRLHHLCYLTAAGFTVVDVWEDEESLGAFAEILMPFVQQAGLDVKPQVYPVQAIVTREGVRTH